MTTDQGPYPLQYPVQFAVDYPDRPLNRLTSFFRIFVIIPIWIVPGTVSGVERRRRAPRPAAGNCRGSRNRRMGRVRASSERSSVLDPGTPN